MYPRLYPQREGVSRKVSLDPNMHKHYDLFNENNDFWALWEVLK